MPERAHKHSEHSSTVDLYFVSLECLWGAHTCLTANIALLDRVFERTLFNVYQIVCRLVRLMHACGAPREHSREVEVHPAAKSGSTTVLSITSLWAVPKYALSFSLLSLLCVSYPFAILHLPISESEFQIAVQANLLESVPPTQMLHRLRSCAALVKRRTLRFQFPFTRR